MKPTKHGREMEAIDTARRQRLLRLMPKLPGAMAVLVKCAAAPCDPDEFGPARETVLRWLQWTKACESAVSYRRAQIKRMDRRNAS